jgi:hypothetical protein
MSYLHEEYKICRWVVLSYELLNSRKAKDFFSDELHTRAIEVWESQGSLWVCQGLSITTKRGREKVKKKKKRKRPRKARRWLQRRQGSVCPKPRIPFFFGSQVFGFRSGPSWLKYWLLHFFSTRNPSAKEVPETNYFTQQKQYLKRTTLCTYSTKAVP